MDSNKVEIDLDTPTGHSNTPVLLDARTWKTLEIMLENFCSNV